MQRWVPLVVTGVLFVGAATWFGYEAYCGATIADTDPPQCTSGDLVYPAFTVAFAGAWLGAGILALRRPLSRDRIDTSVLRGAYWPPLAVFSFFAVNQLGDVGLFILPLLVALLILALWPTDAGPWAVGAGAALNLLVALLQSTKDLYAVREPINAPQEILYMPWWGLATLVASGVFGGVGAPLWPRWWSYIFLVPALGAAWTALFLPLTPPETLFFALPGATLILAGFVRCVVGTFQVRPEKAPEPMYPELEPHRAS